AEEVTRLRRAAALARVPQGSAVLDIGCRDGGLRQFLPRNLRYQGIEITPEFESPEIMIRNISEGIPFPAATFSAAFCIEVLEHVLDPFSVVREIHRVLQPDGILLISVPNPYHWKEIFWNLFRIPDRQGHLHGWTRQTMERFGSMAGFRLEETRGTYFHPPIPAPPLLARSILYRFVRSENPSSP
ncbi:MAG TPA: class I SAM-dependent methyltransferase, partial [bacterium]|nr:class I SAM-dependent methyltransferase [bacterium]